MASGWFVMPRDTREACVSLLGVVFDDVWHDICLGTSILSSSEAIEDHTEILWESVKINENHQKSMEMTKNQ